MTNAPSRRRLTELDALRGLGALLVILFHYSVRFHDIFPRADHVPFRFEQASYRVYLFFAISGFAIFFSLDKVRTARDFAIGRFARLYPAYWTAMLLTLAFQYLGGVETLQVPSTAILVNVTMLEDFLFLPPVDGAYWTLSVELAFYACTLSLWAAFGMKHIERLLFVWVGARLLWMWLPDIPERIVMVTLLREVSFFAIGMVSWRVWAGRRTWLQQVPILAFILMVEWFSDTRELFWVAGGLIAIFYALVSGWLGWLRLRPLMWVGSISYPLYLVHQHIGFVIMLKADAIGLNSWTGFALALVTAFALAIAIHRFVEVPAAEMIRHWWNRRTGARLDERPAPLLEPLFLRLKRRGSASGGDPD